MRIFIKMLAISFAMGGVAVVGSTIASSSVATPADQISETGALPPEATISSFQKASVVPVAPVMTKTDFDQTFADAAAMPRSGNTPGNREKLRNAGWKLITASR
jgi:hypothetical protein